jgi:hypothetical protein
MRIAGSVKRVELLKSLIPDLSSLISGPIPDRVSRITADAGCGIGDCSKMGD